MRPFVPWTRRNDLPNDRIFALWHRRRRLWIGTGNGRAMEAGKLTVFATGGARRARRGPSRHVGAATPEPYGVAALCRLRQGQSIAPGPRPRPRPLVKAIHEDREGDLWIGREAGVCRTGDLETMTAPLSGSGRFGGEGSGSSRSRRYGGHVWAGTGSIGVWNSPRASGRVIRGVGSEIDRGDAPDRRGGLLDRHHDSGVCARGRRRHGTACRWSVGRRGDRAIRGPEGTSGGRLRDWTGFATLR